MKNWMLPLLALWLWASALPAAPTDYQVGQRLAAPGSGKDAEFQVIDWEDLVPADWLSQEWLDSLNLDELDSLEDSDPRAMALLDKIMAKWNEAPVVESLDGQRVRLPGFVVPLEGDVKSIREFLLAPYFGACVHVPPPPANQLIHVLTDKPIPAEWLMMPVWVQGTLRVERFDSRMGNAGYRMKAVKVEEYLDELPE